MSCSNGIPKILEREQCRKPCVGLQSKDLGESLEVDLDVETYREYNVCLFGSRSLDSWRERGL